MPRPKGSRNAPAVGLPPPAANPAPAAPVVAPRRGLRVTPTMLAAAQRGNRSTLRQPLHLRPPSHPPSAVPDGATIAQDSAINETFGWANGQLAQDSTFEIAAAQAQTGIAGPYDQALANGYGFLGFAYLGQLAQIAEYRVVTETIAGEMTREWIEFDSVGDDKTDKIKNIENEFKKLGVQNACRKMAEGDGFFGRGHLYLDTGATDDRDELLRSIGDGHNVISKGKVAPEKPLIGVRPVEALWCYPNGYNSNDPLSSDWYRPLTWFVNGKEVHRTRLLTVVGREVPDILKPAYSFGGLSMSQMIRPYVDNWIRTRQAVADLIWSFTVSVLKTPMQADLAEDGGSLFARIALFTALRNNRSVAVLSKDEEEEFSNIVTPLGTLDMLQAQSQEHMASVSRIPLVKLLGIQPGGLNASSEGEIRSFYDWIKAFQEVMFRAPIIAILGFVQLSLFGFVDPEITFHFKDLWQLDEAGKVGVEKTKTDIDDANVAMGAIDPLEVRRRLANDKDSIYAGLDLDPDKLPEQPEIADPMLDPTDSDDPNAVHGNGLERPLGAGESGKSTVPLVHDPHGQSPITKRAANFGSPATGGFKQ